ncbi:MAG: radical SAM protein [Chlamydiota bacterium]
MTREQYQELKRCNEQLLEKEIADKKTVLAALPTEATIYFSKKCNLLCIKCFRNFPSMIASHHDMPQEMFESLAEQIFPTLLRAEPTLYGEPLMCSYWDRIVALFKHYGVMLHLTTNGTLLTEEVIESLNGVTDFLKVSCDACDKETYESIHRGATFETTVNNLKAFGRMKKHMTLEPRFRLGIVLMKRNIDSLPRYVEFAKEVGADEVQTLGLVTYHPDFRKEELFDIPARANAAITAAIKRAKELGIDLELGFNRVPDPAYALAARGKPQDTPAEGGFRSHEGATCPYFFHRPYIFGDGTVVSCGNCETKVMGNLREHAFSEIWNNARYQDMRRAFYGGLDHWYDICSRCICINTAYDMTTYRKDFGIERSGELSPGWAAINERIPSAVRRIIPRGLKLFIKAHMAHKSSSVIPDGWGGTRGQK